jgi:preprotein translocase subunit SecF
MASKSTKQRLHSRFGKKFEETKSTTTKAKKIHTGAPQKELKGFYFDNYKQLLLIPFTLLLVAIVLLFVQHAQTGDFINRGISLKGGTAITITDEATNLADLDVDALEASLRNAYAQADLTVRTQRQLGDIRAVEVVVDLTEREDVDAFKNSIAEIIPGIDIAVLNENTSTNSPVLGESFFSQIIRALIVGFILMAIVIFIQFRVVVPSAAVILAVFSNTIITLAIVNLLGVKLSTAGIAAFLMLIGYSVDTDVLLSTRLLKNKEGSVTQRLVSALKTGITMNVTTLAAVLIALIFTTSDVIRQIMLILTIGLLVDMVNTWIQNAGILRWYIESKEAKK